MIIIQLSKRQADILRIVKDQGPISGEEIASSLKLARATLRPDLSFLTMAGILEARPKVGYYYTGKNIQNVLAEVLQHKLVKEIMGMPVAVMEDTSVYDAIVTLFLEDVGTLFVVKDRDVLTGVISRKDFLRATLGDQDLEKLPVGIIMTRMPNIITIKDNDSVLLASQKMKEFQVDCLPVIQSNGDDHRLIGRVSKTHIIRMISEIGQ